MTKYNYENPTMLNPWGSPNIAVKHQNGELTNEKIQELSNDELKYFSYDGDIVKVEKYVRVIPTGTKKMGDKEGDIYWGTHRAVLELKRRCG